MDAIVEIKEHLVEDFLQYLSRINKSNVQLDYFNMCAKIIFIETNSKLDKFHFIYEKII